ncbi:hypothetical protein EUC41_31090 [Achromobacter denitrificans]|nr:hypothetical protein [Achromobacter denitrificans]MDX3878147.1 hypothetical protein [Achromobacter sp.]WFC70361.1 hypothetical protein EUC41_31090 [Achromobacter denitrificans]
MNMAYVQHPLSAAFPAMSAPDFQALKDSIECIGVQNEITLFEGMVIDGWHRYSASQELGMSCPERELPADVDPVDFVKAQNKERRHLSAGAWALIETELWQWQPAFRPAANKSLPGRDLTEEGTNSMPSRELPAKTAAEMAASAGVGVATIERAKKVNREAAPEMKAAVKSGAVSLKDAHAVSDLSEEEQAALVAAGPAAVKEAARAKQRKPTPPPEAETPPVTPPNSGGDEDHSAEMLADYERLAADNQMMGRVFEADDRLAAAMKEIARLEEENRALRTRVNGLINEKDAAVKAIKACKRRLDALEKQKGAA